jgi:beta-glucosidase-like glycosyl hydrolase
VLSPHDFVRAFDAIEAAVKSGKLTEERINQSVRRILLLKITTRR